MINKIHTGDSLELLSSMPDDYVNCCVTSPPYWCLRDYGMNGQLGQEKTPEEFIRKLVMVFTQVFRVMKADGTLWLNIGDSYASGPRNRTKEQSCASSTLNGTLDSQMASLKQSNKIVGGLKPKDMIGIPWMLAFALRDVGWYLRSDIIWHKKNCMPESVRDRPTKSHEHIFLLSKSRKYYYDYEAIQEPAIYDVNGIYTDARKARQHIGNKSNPTEKVNGMRSAGFKDAGLMNGKNADKQRGHSRRHAGFNDRWDNMTKKEQCTGMRNKRDVWIVAPAQLSEAHFATFPEHLIVPCIKAGCPEGGIILDPFIGAGTTALVARKLNRNFIGCELNPDYVTIANNRLKQKLGLFL